ncbi:AraC family transcriptional regulator [Nitrincola iocasae]|uniref:AraC family transcriptional regulator n=1 Tax=Nitrincola iocasae TaxID=2614693 RepID=A0A5J6LDE8_9GAMM|nr:AraC family transcriptional regulator [Nitrincola iocasae]QEW06625.1 AraC family transcriptional regulator [Nitrincola iocasae]
MTDTVRDVDQHFWSSKFIPYLTIRTTQNSTQSYKAHCHPELSVGLIESGITQLSMSDGTVILKKEDIILIEPNIVHACNPVEGMPRSYHMLYIDNEWCCNVLSKLYGYEVKKYSCDLNLLPVSENDIKLSDLIFSLLHHGFHNDVIEVERYLLNLVSRYCSPQSEHEEESELVCKLKNRFLQDLAYAPSLETVSKEFGRPKETLIRVFKKHYGITPKSFLNNSRIEKAKILLKHGMSIVDVAAELGFSDQSQFHRTFVNYTASTPRQYQQVTSIFDNKS